MEFSDGPTLKFDVGSNGNGIKYHNRRLPAISQGDCGDSAVREGKYDPPRFSTQSHSCDGTGRQKGHSACLILEFSVWFSRMAATVPSAISPLKLSLRSPPLGPFVAINTLLIWGKSASGTFPHVVQERLWSARRCTDSLVRHREGQLNVSSNPGLMPPRDEHGPIILRVPRSATFCQLFI